MSGQGNAGSKMKVCLLQTVLETVKLYPCHCHMTVYDSGQIT